MKFITRIFYTFLLLFVALFFGIPHARAADAWYDTTWTNRVKITFNNADQAENLTNFPVLVTLGSSNISYASTQNAGQDIRFTDSDGTTLLSYEIEKWDETGSSIVWVKVPQVDASSATDYIYMYYGNSSATDSQNITDVWSNGFVGVWHLKETGNGTADEYHDSSPTGANGQGGGGTSTSVPTLTSSGAIGNSAYFDGGDYINAGSSSAFKFTNTPFTFTAWVNPDNLAAIQIAFGNDNVSTGWNTRVITTGQFGFVTRGATQTFNSTATITAGSWSHISGTYSGDPDKFRALYKNGTFSNSETYSGDIISGACNFLLGSRWNIGSCTTPTGFFLGKIDEIRISNVVRTANWLAASYKSESSTFNTYASAETSTVTPSTPPSSAQLDTPADKSYTNNERPTFRWKTSPDDTSTLAKYVFEIDNPSMGASQPSGDFSIDDISVSSTTDIETNKYLIHYENFSDTDATNNYISVHTKSSSEWGSDQNDGKLREGVVSWKVKTRNTSGVDATASHTLFVDRTNPNATFAQINSTPINTSSFSSSDTTPTIFGKITDPLAGGDSTLTQTKYGPRVASGPKQAEIKIEKKEGTFYTLHTLYTLQLNSSQFTCDGKEITDNSDQSCDKYAPFEYISAVPLEPGTYKVTLTGRDNVDNTSSETSILLTIGGVSQSVVPSEPIQEITQVSPTPVPTITEEKPAEQTSETSNIFTALVQFLSAIKTLTEQAALIAFANVYQTVNQTLTFINNRITYLVQDLTDTYRDITSTAPGAIQFVLNTIDVGLTASRDTITLFIQTVQIAVNNIDTWTTTFALQIAPTVELAQSNMQNIMTNAAKTYDQVADAISKTNNTVTTNVTHIFTDITTTIQTMSTQIARSVGQSFTSLAINARFTASEFSKTLRATSAILGNGFTTIAEHSTGIPKIILAGIFDITNTIGTVTNSITNAISASTDILVHKATETSVAIFDTTTRTIIGANVMLSAINKRLANQISNTAFFIGEKTQDISDTAGYAIINFTYNFVSEPTTISDVAAVALSPTSAKVTWTTNHPANGKVNWGLEDGIYTFEDQTNKRTTHHEFILTNLTPGTEYNYEVMSHNKNYVYDANRKFHTPVEE